MMIEVYDLRFVITRTKWMKLGFACGLPNSMNHLWPEMTCKMDNTLNPLIIENSSVSDGFNSRSKLEMSENGFMIFSSETQT